MLALLGTAVVAGIVFSGCEKSPDPLHLDNLFDPDGTTGGDGLQLRVLASANRIILIWDQPQNKDITEYFLFEADSRNGAYEELAIVAHTTEAVGRYFYEYPAPTQEHWFKAQAITASGGFSLTSLAVPAVAELGPTVVVGDTVSVLATRYPELSVTTNLGETLLVALERTAQITPGTPPDTVYVGDYTNATSVPVAGLGVPTVFTRDLGPADPDSTFWMYVKAVDALGETLETGLKLPVTFEPKHALVDANSARLATRVNDLKIPTLGVLQMRFAASETELSTAPWLPAAEIYPDYELSDSANPQEIWGEFEGDFGFNFVHSLTVRPDLLGAAAFRLKVPQNRIISDATVVAEFTAQATEMRVSENPNFAMVPWRAYSDTLNFALSPGEGTKTVYAQYRNDWTESTIFSDYCIYVSQGIAVKIIAPANESVILGGSTYQVVGTSSAGTNPDGIENVRLDLGDGLGFREVIGAENWQATWTVPTFEEDTAMVLRARAYADSGATVVTDVATVTVTQPIVTIDSPLDGAEVAGGAPIIISGTALTFLGGSAVDLVTVDVGGVQLTATGTDIWTATWNAPTIGAPTSVDITATMWVGDVSATRTITVTLTP
jgi:hypothetical protein